jgi:hypothetical protein
MASGAPPSIWRLVSADGLPGTLPWARPPRRVVPADFRRSGGRAWLQERRPGGALSYRAAGAGLRRPAAGAADRRHPCVLMAAGLAVAAEGGDWTARACAQEQKRAVCLRACRKAFAPEISVAWPRSFGNVPFADSRVDSSHLTGLGPHAPCAPLQSETP